MNLNRAARAYIVVVALLAIAAQALLLAAPPRPVDLLVLGQLAALGVLSQRFVLPAGEKREISFTIAVHYALLLVAGPALATAVVGAGVLLAKGGLALWDHRARAARPRQTVRGVLFNTSQSMLSVALAGWAAGHVPPGQGALAVVVSGGVMYLTNTALVAGVIALQQHRNPLAVWLDGRAWSLLQTGAPMALAVVVVGAAQAYVWAPLAMALPAALTYVALKRTTEAEAAVRLRDEFLDLAAHELRTPVTALRAYAGLLRRNHELAEREGTPAYPEPFGRGLRTMDEQSAKLVRLIDQLLDVSYAQTGRLAPDHQPLDVGELARHTVAALQPILPANPIRLWVAGPALIAGDALRFDQVLTNLITNAAKHGGPGPIDVDVERRQSQVWLSVRDRGPGVPEAERGLIFDRYYQRPGAQRTGGLGLGLYLARQLVQLHGGAIAVEAPADGDGGARFVVTLPARRRRAVGLAPATVRSDSPPATGHALAGPTDR